jgi:hypothetical protein
MASPQKHCCPACGAAVFERGFVKCERCHRALPPEMLYSEAEKQSMQETARRAAALNRKITKIINAIVIAGILAIWATVLWSRGPGWKEISAVFAVFLAVALFKLWAMSRDDGLNPALHEKPA